MDERRSYLDILLREHGLKIKNNDVCLQYIYLGENSLYSPDQIAIKLAQNKFLNEFCDHASGLKLARDQCSSVRLTRDQWLQRVRRCVLKASGYDDFPKVWPWRVEEQTTTECPMW